MGICSGYSYGGDREPVYKEITKRPYADERNDPGPCFSTGVCMGVCPTLYNPSNELKKVSVQRVSSSLSYFLGVVLGGNPVNSVYFVRFHGFSKHLTVLLR